MKKNRLPAYCVLSVWILSSMIGLAGCVAAVPMVVRAMKGSETSTATVLINEDAAKVYAEAVKAIKKRGYTEIKKKDDVKFFIEGIRKGKNATFQATSVGTNQTQAIITIENDKEAKVLNEAVQALMEVCGQLGLQCEQQKG